MADLGDSGNSWMLVIGLGSLLLNFIVTICGGVWALSRNNNKIVEKFNEKVEKKNEDFTNSMTALERKFEDSVSRTSHDFGEGLSAMRTKINDTELWNRDNFVSKNTFQLVIGEIKESWRRFEDKMDRRLDKIDAKLDEPKVAE